jgi:CheY-like chemotaxis protein
MSGKKILYVEDNEANRMIVRDLLKRTTYELIEAFDGEAGVAKALEARPDLILMDIQLPKISGLDAIKRIRAQPSLPARRSLRSRRLRFRRRPEGEGSRRDRLSCEALQPVRAAEACAPLSA